MIGDAFKRVCRKFYRTRWAAAQRVLCCAVALAAVLLITPPQFAGAFQDAESSADAEAVEDALDAIRSGETAKGMAILQRLGEQANPLALFHLAEMARIGVGREQSMSIAIMYYRLAGQLGHGAAAMKLANILYFDGTGSEAEIGEALSIWQTQALQGNAEAAYLLGIIYWNGEHGRQADPVRGYGLILRAAQAGYPDAEQTELTMRAQLPAEARAEAQAYADRLEELGFSNEALALDLLVEDYEPETAEADNEVARPEDWSKVWRLEVGFAMREDDANELLKRIKAEEGQTVSDLYGEVTASPNRPGMFRLVFGPIARMHDAVSRCVSLKRAGYDCFAQPPVSE